uniref:Uncharacterized protein n=1 Tax=Timema cristinae TaxID=61476 RepID=A0A7R9CTM3_TIMCR|nr:unnamed protein product [Timema cristinae]
MVLYINNFYSRITKPTCTSIPDKPLQAERGFIVGREGQFYDVCNSSQLRQWELAHQWITKSRLPPGLNRI